MYRIWKNIELKKILKPFPTCFHSYFADIKSVLILHFVFMLQTINRVFDIVEALKRKLLQQYSQEYSEYLADKVSVWAWRQDVFFISLWPGTVLYCVSKVCDSRDRLYTHLETHVLKPIIDNTYMNTPIHTCTLPRTHVHSHTHTPQMH